MGYNVQKIYVGQNKVRPPEADFKTKGPCPNGFHVPLSAEWYSIYNAGTSLGAWNSSGSDSISYYLKLPISGYRNYSNSTAYQAGRGYYWSSNASISEKAIIMLFGNNSIYPNDTAFRPNGFHIRPFKNTPESPTSSRTTRYQGSGSAGIYWNSSLGLISISSDGTNWITISDKNLGATAIYNYGATLSESNCGKYYQWGNNYGFPYTGGVSTSSTRVNASNYGPGNYYSSSTFITSTSWDSSDNYNLWGGVDGNVPM